MTYDKESSKKYYLENRERILQRQKERYQNNPEYRNKMIEINKKLRHEVKIRGRLNTYG